MAKKSKRNKKKPNKSTLDPFAAQKKAIEAAKQELKDAQAAMRNAMTTKSEIENQVNTLKQQSDQAEAQKYEAEMNLERSNNDMATSLQSPATTTTPAAPADSTSSPSSSPSLPSYGDKQYWNERYSKEMSNSKAAALQVDEWYIDDLPQLTPFLSAIVHDKTEQRVLDLGCGTSTIGDQMSAAGYQHMYCVDYSEAVIQTCRARQKEAIRNGLASPVYKTMDARSLEFSDGYFRCVLDKGTMDAILSGGASGGEQAAKEAMESATAMVAEIHRVLEEHGTYILVSSMPPDVYLPAIQEITAKNQFDVQHSKLAAAWSKELSLQVYTLKKLRSSPSLPAGLPSGLPFSEEQLRMMMQYARAAQDDQQGEQQELEEGSNNHVSFKASTLSREPTPVKSKPIALTIINKNETHVWVKWNIDMRNKTIVAAKARVGCKEEGVAEEEEEEEEEAAAEWGLTPMKHRVGTEEKEEKKEKEEQKETIRTQLIGGSDRDYIILSREDVPSTSVHPYESMEWLDIPEDEEEEEEDTGNVGFGLTPVKTEFVEETSSRSPFLEGIIKFPLPNKEGAYNFRFVAESIAWGLKADMVVHVSDVFEIGTGDKKVAPAAPSTAPSTAMETPTSPTSATGASNQSQTNTKNDPFSAPLSGAQTMSTLVGPPLPPSMLNNKSNQNIVQLSYLLEKRTNISCYQLFVHRPIDAVGDVALNAPAPPVPSPPHVRLCLDLKYNPSLSCTRKELILSFNNEANAITYVVHLSFADCNIDPKKSTFVALNGHWSFRLPFYFGGSEMDVDREHPTYRLPRRGEISTKALGTVRCKFCESEFFNINGVRRVTRAPSQYWSELSDYWFCLKEQASDRLTELSAHGGEYPIGMNDVVIDRCSLLSVYESDGLDLKDKICILPLKSSTDGGSPSSGLPAPGCQGTTYEIVQPSTSIPNSSIRKGLVVEVHARGIIQETNETFWDTKKTNGSKTFQYTAGVGAVIKGWDQGCLGMKTGEQRKLIIPSHEGYGSAGFPQWNIPPNATLIFHLECISVRVNSASTKAMLRNELTKVLLAEEKKEEIKEENKGKNCGESCDGDGCYNQDRNEEPQLESPAALLCQRCFSIIGTSQLRNNGTHVVRMWKCHLRMSSTETTEGKVAQRNSVKKKHSASSTLTASTASTASTATTTTFDRYLVDSIVGHAILDGMEQRGVTRYILQSFSIDDDGENCIANDGRIEMKITVLNANEFASSHEFPHMQPIIRILYEAESTKDRSSALWQRETATWTSKNAAERIMLSEEDVSEMIDRLEWTTTLLPASSQTLNGMSVGLLRW